MYQDMSIAVRGTIQQCALTVHHEVQEISVNRSRSDFVIANLQEASSE